MPYGRKPRLPILAAAPIIGSAQARLGLARVAWLVFAGVNAALREDAYANLDRLNQQLLGVVQETLEPESVSLWLRR